jgi:transcriptional regulator with XRE-family HTH domain
VSASVVAKNIKAIRACANMTQDGFAKTLGVKPSLIRDIEACSQRVNEDFLFRLIARFPVDLNWLFSVADGPRPAAVPASIGVRLREERVRLGFSQRQFAALAGQGRLSQIRYESGKRSPDANYLIAICAAGADSPYIVTGNQSRVAVSRDPEAASLVALGVRAAIANYDASVKRNVQVSAFAKVHKLIRPAFQHLRMCLVPTFADNLRRAAQHLRERGFLGRVAPKGKGDRSEPEVGQDVEHDL